MADDAPESWDDDAPDNWDDDEDETSPKSEVQPEVLQAKAQPEEAKPTIATNDTKTPVAKSAAKPDIDQDPDDSSDEGTDDSDGKQSLKQYRQLLSRRVDLVGDYAGNELFLIEGDSLLLRCFTDEKLDFDPGFQMLQAAYNVEHFLLNLALRKCNFNVAFFESNKALCMPGTANPEHAAKYYLARAAIIRHLEVNLATSHPKIAIRKFSSYTSAEFAQWLTDVGPYFIMTHDGALPTERQEKHIQHSKFELQDGRGELRQMIISFICRGFNVALVNGLEWRDTKVMTMVLERRSWKLAPDFLKHTEVAIKSTSVDVSSDLKKIETSAPGLTERQQLAVIAVTRLIANPPSSLSKRQVLLPLCAAFLIHEALLAHLPLSSRRFDSGEVPASTQGFLNALASLSERILTSPSWTSTVFSSCDVIDYLDGRLLFQVCDEQISLNLATKKTFETLLAVVEKLSTDGLPIDDKLLQGVEATNGNTPIDQSPRNLAVMPFSNDVFDQHLASVHLKEDDAAAGEQTLVSHRVFREMTHWHNAKKPIIVKAPPTTKQLKDEFWAAKRNQLFMAEMRTYAGSLTNAVGKSLDPETIIVGAAKLAPEAEKGPKSLGKRGGIDSPAESDADSTTSSSKGKAGSKKGGGGKNAKQNAGKQAMYHNIAAEKAKKDQIAGNKIANAWQVACKNFEADRDPRARYRQAKEYLAYMRPEWRDVVAAECELFMLSSLLQYWISACRRGEQSRHLELTALIWDTAGKILKSKSVTKQVVASVELTVKTLGLPPVPPCTVTAPSDRKLAFTFALPSKVEGLSVGLKSRDFQLLHGGPYLERSFDSAKDHRVDFEPDGWQREVLDGIDANKSMFVVAPTSAGKTFISFYAMKKILQASDDDVIVYVAPTKALVNQIAAEIQARYSKNFKHGGKSVYAIHTRDYRINNVIGAQVLVTVPHVLQIMLLAPQNANSWSSRVKRIIFDEVHSIGQAEDGVVWEQLLLLAPCPIIALSATVGNPKEFSDWLTSTQKAIGIELKTVHHPHRYSDLRKYFYLPPKKFEFSGLPAKSTFGSLGLEGLTGFSYVHPVAALVDKTRGIPEDLALEPRDCFFLWQAMVEHQTANFIVPKDLDPNVTLPDVSRKVDILKWETGLKTLLQQWLVDLTSPFDEVLKELAQSFRYEKREEVQSTIEKADHQFAVPIKHENSTVETTLPLLCKLHEQDALPAILFNYDRHDCEEICQTLTEQLKKNEEEQQKSGGKWQKTLERWEEWKKVQAKAAAKKGKVTKKGKGDDDDEVGSKLDQQRDAGEQGADIWDSFDPDKPLEGYHFADYSKVQKSELDIYVKQLGKRNVPQWLIDSIGRGIGVHHAGMNRKYRQVVEILFRKGYLRVIIATGTLALGINMPCKTVVFSGDSVFLTALNYRQCAGRAGRRGFDLLGNVVFQGLSRQKVCRLISSRLPDLNGHFPITTTLVLRLFTLLHESKGSKYAVGAINALLSQPRMYMGGASFKDQTMHHLRFSIEYLRRQHLLDARGATLNFAGLVSHLYFTENSAFGFHALLKEGYFHELCAGVHTNEKSTLETLMLVMAHLFSRIPCRQSDAEDREKVTKGSSSMVFLPPMPPKASQILYQHNQETLRVFKTYVETFAEQHLHDADRTLPLTGLNAGGDDSAKSGSHVNALPTPIVRSPFIALSGSGDDFETIHELCQTTRDGIFLEEAVIPHLNVSPDEMDVPLNAWLLDFYKHGDIHTIERANGIRRADIWFLLNDFSLVMATIITSLLNFMKLQEGTDVDMLDVMGSMDAHEEAEDDKVTMNEAASEVSGPSIADSAISIPEHTKPTAVVKKAKNAESWEDVASAEESVIESEERRAATAARLQAEAEAEGDSDWNEKGLKDVLKALQKLHAEFTVKFRAMWA